MSDLTDWKPISTAPKDNKPFLAMCGNEILCVHWGEFKDVFVVYNPNCHCCIDRCTVSPEWWRELPEKPVCDHICQNKEWLCRRIGKNLYLHNQTHKEQYNKVNYCPLCGVKA